MRSTRSASAGARCVDLARGSAACLTCLPLTVLFPKMHNSTILLNEALRCVDLSQVEAIQSVCPEVTDDEAVKALELCGDRFAAAPVAFLVQALSFNGAAALNKVTTVVHLQVVTLEHQTEMAWVAFEAVNSGWCHAGRMRPRRRWRTAHSCAACAPSAARCRRAPPSATVAARPARRGAAAPGPMAGAGQPSPAARGLSAWTPARWAMR